MIKPQDLRTGNLLLYTIGITDDGSELINEPTAIDWQDIKWCDEKNEDFNHWHKPIPLTEEWLLKMRFSRQDLQSSIAYYIEIEEDTRLQLWLDGSVRIWRNVNGGWREGWYNLPQKMHPKYVHALQNLFYALTGEELTLTNEK